MVPKKKHKKWLLIVGSILILIIIITLLIIRWVPSFQRQYSAEEMGIQEITSPLDKDNDGIDDYRDILEGARAYIRTEPVYEDEYVSGGYPNDGKGVCTDVIWQALAAAGYDLKQLVDEDIMACPDRYHDIEEPDPNIDFRRVRILNCYLAAHADVLTTDLNNPADWQAGDIVVFNKHIAICSDIRNTSGIPFILHHSPIGAREADDMDAYTIAAHYRWNGELN